MPRVKNGVAKLRKKRRLMRRAKGFEGNRSKLLRQAKETVLRAEAFATKHRRKRKSIIRRLWIVRINAACRSRGLTYGQFIRGLRVAGVSLDRKVMSDMAIRDVAGFERLVAMARAAGVSIDGEARRIREELESGLGAAPDERRVEDLRVRLLGKKGALTGLLRGLKDLGPEERAAAGKALNELKEEVSARLDAAAVATRERARDERLRREWVDITLDAGRRPVGNLHPVSQIQYEIEDAFTSMGFQVLDGPHVETDYYNFEALNIPEHHPARDMQDTFYLEDGNLLRTHTSAIQVRGMGRLKPPFKIIGPGKVFRCERIDASHEATFHQLEGMMVDRNIQVAHLIYFEKELLRRIFGREVEVRLRPGYFPFVEPGFELDVRCLICGGRGCPVCKGVGWVELVPCGMVHPNVLRFGGIEAAEFSGFAFGLGLDRLVMMKYGIDDIRLLHGADLRFLRQFA